MSSRPSSVSDMLSPRSAFKARLAASGPFGLGASSLGNLYRTMDDRQATSVVDAAWDAGVRLFDTAPFYGFGLSERRLGEALAGKPRKDVILSTKVGRVLVHDDAVGDANGFLDTPPFRAEFDYTYDGVLRSFESSLERLGTDRVELLVMHDIGRATHGEAHDRHWRDAVDGGFKALQRLREEGAVDAIGLGVNEVDICYDSLDHADLDVLLVANRYTLLDTSADDLFSRCRRNDVGVIAAGVFSSGILATGAASSARFEYRLAPDAITTRVKEIQAVCERFDVPLPAVSHHFVRRHGGVTQTLLGLRDVDEVATAIGGVHRAIPAEIWPALQSLEE